MSFLKKLGIKTFSQRTPSNVGKWDGWHGDVTDTELYGDDTTYKLAADFLSDCREVEDWGCGKGGFRNFCRTEYIGIDGSKSKFVDKIADLATYQSTAEGILLRHVLEHNVQWDMILANAVASFRKKLCLIIFTPFADKTKEIRYFKDLDVPDIAFLRTDLTKHFAGLDWKSEEGIPTKTDYHAEHVFYVQKPDKS